MSERLQQYGFVAAFLAGLLLIGVMLQAIVEPATVRADPNSGAAPSAERGHQLATACTGCHGGGFAGGVIPGASADWPKPANLTPGGKLAGWSDEQFLSFMHTGRNPEGKQVDGRYMPWSTFATVPDNDLRSILLYLRSLPSKADGTR